jgi:mRNA interferase MazF
VITRGSICWVDLGAASRSKPARSRPVLVIQGDPYNASRLATTLAAVITSNTAQAAVAGNVFVPAAASGLAKDSVINLTALVTVNKTDLDQPVGHLPDQLMHEVEAGLRLILGLDR